MGKLLWKLALPTVAAQLINMLYNIVDRIYIGHIPDIGALALTGVGVCMPLIMIVTAFAALVSSGGAPRASIFMGRGDHEAAERTLGNCFCLQLIISVLLTAVLLVWDRDILMEMCIRDRRWSAPWRSGASPCCRWSARTTGWLSPPATRGGTGKCIAFLPHPSRRDGPGWMGRKPGT